MSTTTVKTALCLAAAALWATTAPAPAHAQGALAATLKKLYLATSFDAVEPSPVKGLAEVVMGANVAYVDETGRYFVFGRLYDMREQRDLTAERLDRLTRVDFATLPLEASIVTVKGSGARRLAVFSDPDCPYCRTLEREIVKLDDVTVYTFLYPIEALHPGAGRKATAVWCAPDKATAWADLMLRGIEPPPTACANPIAANLALGARLRIQGTPTLFAGDGRRSVGAQSAGELDAWLGAGAKQSAEAGR
jgi:thiol:disulfide interchange protein DsbC